jgi:hypothetical protein
MKQSRFRQRLIVVVVILAFFMMAVITVAILPMILLWAIGYGLDPGLRIALTFATIALAITLAYILFLLRYQGVHLYRLVRVRHEQST